MSRFCSRISGRLSVPTRYREQLLENAAGQMV
ncbi:hypothetical protein O5287_29220, partial [Escherichia coli]|nr:hypothetical protein [Escherichia coli]